MNYKRLTFACLMYCLCCVGLNCSLSSATTNDGQIKNLSNDAVNAFSLDKNDADVFKQTAQPKSLLVTIGVISAVDNKLEFNGDLWNYDGDDVAKLYPNNEVEVDIMNCAGYMGSAKAVFASGGNGRLEVKFIPGSIAPDAVQKIKQCTLEPNDEIIGCQVFGIAPTDGKRKNIKIAPINRKKLYNELLKDIDESSPEEKAAEETKQPEMSEEAKEPIIGEPKYNLNLRDDNWTDMDGDGKIDLILFQDSPCEEKYACTWIYQFVKGKWKLIQSISPA